MPLELDGDEIHRIEAALEDVGFNATLVEERPPSMASSSDAPAIEVAIHLERDEEEDGDVE